MKRWTVWTVLLLAAAGPAYAGLCDNDERPAATLLLPYFEVNLDDPNGVTTVFSINNAYDEAVLAHVTLWTDLAVPALNFDVYLTGFDVQAVNLRDIFNGFLPRTASAGQDPADTLSPQGEFSQDVNFASCNGQLPLPNLPATLVNHIRNAFTGKFSAVFNGCAGRDRGDNVARGYVTVDTVSACTLKFPGDPDYFAAGGQGIATNQNALFGDYALLNPGRGAATGNPLVHIEAFDNAFQPGDYTFYGSAVSWSGADGREPLATTFGVRGVSGATDLLVWRDPKVVVSAMKCPAQPPWSPLGQESLIAFDTEENPAAVTTRPFQIAAQRIRMDSNRLPVPHEGGWLYLNLNTVVADAGANPPQDPAAAQAWSARSPAPPAAPSPWAMTPCATTAPALPTTRTPGPT
jgi:hypothetical protein